MSLGFLIKIHDCFSNNLRRLYPLSGISGDMTCYLNDWSKERPFILTSDEQKLGSLIKVFLILRANSP